MKSNPQQPIPDFEFHYSGSEVQAERQYLAGRDAAAGDAEAEPAATELSRAYFHPKTGRCWLLLSDAARRLDVKMFKFTRRDWRKFCKWTGGPIETEIFRRPELPKHRRHGNDWRHVPEDVINVIAAKMGRPVYTVASKRATVPIAASRAQAGTTPKRKGRPRGPASDTNPERDARFAKAWATKSYRTYRNLAREFSEEGTEFTEEDVRQALDRHRKARRAGK